ncbi:uncharacterized protein LOC128962809 [Oppia nitens]|uniref:uncharacterized protein LOC128962809 n=1 Tax=Oppia nitens TaxID=1686743 RepID=UPI0023DB6B60|nr:uncharacterized protein LOC128962809 [Oppia nitens]
MKVIYMIVLMLTIASMVSNESKDFCEEYRKNDYKIGFAMSLYKTYGYDEDMILLFISNTYWKVSNKMNSVVTIDTLSAGTSNWLSSDKYAMVWPNNYNYDHKDICLYCALQKNMHTIDWAFCNDTNVNHNGIKLTTSITFPDNFKPDIVWSNINVERYLIFANNTKHIHYFVEKNIFSIEVKSKTSLRENNWRDNHYNIIAISQQYIGNSLQSIIFMSDNKTIQYCYVVFDDKFPAGCQPKDIRTMIDCNQPTTPQTNQSMISIIIDVRVLAVVIFIAILILTIASMVSNESKDFCDEYRKNDYKICFAMSLYKEYGYDEDMILLFIGNTYWKLSNKRDTVVTIDTLSAGTSNWLTSNKYAMAWPHIYQQYYSKDNCLYGALQKDMHTIDWANTLCNDMNVITEWINSTTNITFPDNYFKPDFCEPENFKTMVDCSPQIKQSMISIIIAVIVRVLAVVNFIGALILY